MHVRESGAGRPILFLHGWACHGGFFAPQLEGLSSEARVLAPDLVANASAGGAAAAPSIEQIADACADLIAERNLRDIVLAGWSMGAIVAWSLIERHGLGRIAGLVVIDISPRILNDACWRLGTRDGLDAARSRRFETVMQRDWPRIAERVGGAMLADGGQADPRLRAWCVGEIRKGDPAVLAPLWHSLAAQDFRALLPRIDRPVLVVNGARSRLYAPEVAAWQASRLPHASRASFAQSGHTPHLEEPEAFNLAVSRFQRAL